jgi:hypothetical protein
MNIRTEVCLISLTMIESEPSKVLDKDDSTEVCDCLTNVLWFQASLEVELIYGCNVLWFQASLEVELVNVYNDLV